ncbi:hypothetical protein NL676_031177 [Syzygium grande]|nr:hypothetical protein NL676_031177 [Syzygium grande]
MSMQDWVANHFAIDMPNQIVEAERVQKEDTNAAMSSLEATVATDASARGEPVVAANPEPSTTGKRKRGRPRKSDSDETTMGPPPTPARPTAVLPAPLALPVPPPFAGSSSTRRRRRGRPKKSYKIKLMRTPPSALVHKVGPTFKPYVLSVPAGRDIIQELLAYVQEEHETVVPITATGEVSSVAFHSSNPGGEKTTFEGRFVINVLQGSLNRKYGLLTLWMTDTDGAHIGGCLAGPLIAGNQVQIVFGTLEDTIERKYKRRRSATAPAAAGEVDDGELVDVPVRAGETVEANANGSSPGPEGSDGGEPIMASPITIVPQASSLPEGSEEEEPIMASPITIVPPASSPPEGSEEEEPIMASPITIVPPASSPRGIGRGRADHGQPYYYRATGFKSPRGIR